ncbi:uncharacterized protein EAE97_001030 [Botrytis byssoidea]|uniref:Uncharacterized protein n=1 Tax=Botrytis byssoidea TaxID=139641 RepID=A0A9P5LYS0_9HELO|nr:uncharacterized protein EAE97_001030 [Botrytis byssoidea]KAF7953631.1 hypothetical protein EAE97_001030 [Botrytis byssoidea]
MAPYRYHVSDGIDTCPPYHYSRCVPQILYPTVCAADDGYFLVGIHGKPARSANSNYIKPLAERTTNKKAHQLVGRHPPPSQTDFVLTSCDGWQSKQHFPN